MSRQDADSMKCAEPHEGRAVDAHFADTYRELRRMAHGRLRAGHRDTLIDTTALVHESYLRLAGGRGLNPENRSHFVSYVGRVMRSIIVDLVRKRMAGRHGGAGSKVTLDAQIADGAGAGEEEILRVHEALRDLAKLDPRMVRIVEMRYFAGMTECEVAQALEVADRTVRREWEKARLWLWQALS